MDQAQPVFDLLQPMLRKHPEYVHLYTPYAKASQQLGLRTEAYRALAELSYAQGNLYQAVNYLDQALAVPQLDQYERLSLEARREMVKAEVKRIEEPVSPTSAP
jgi:predicted Zn-dependent protease